MLIRIAIHHDFTTVKCFSDTERGLKFIMFEKVVSKISGLAAHKDILMLQYLLL